MLRRLIAFTIITCWCSSCNEDDYLDGYNRDLLFALPTQQELDAVTADWQSRDLSPQNYLVEQTVDVLSNRATLKIISFSVGGFKEYGALFVPKSSASVPVRIFVGGFDIHNTETSVNLMVNDAFFDHPFIFAFPSLRGQSLHFVVNGTGLKSPISEGIRCDAFDRGTDDVIAFLNIIEHTEDNADVNRVGIRGGSRGGTVALLTAERDKRVKLAVSVAAPANMMELTSRSENDLTYQCQFLDGLVNKSATISETRHKLLASSPVFFANELPKTQLHLAINDIIVPVSQGDELKNAMSNLGKDDLFELFVYEGRDHSTIANDNTDLNRRIEQFLSQL